MADIRIDRYEVDVTTNGQTLTVTDVGNLNNAFVKPIASSIKNSGGRTDSTSNLIPSIAGVAIQLTATDTVTFYRNNTTGTCKVMFEIWVYTGSSGGAYEFIVRQRGNLTVSNGTNGNTAPITGLLNRNRAVPVYQGYTTPETSNSDYEACALACHINSSSEVSFGRGGNGAGSPITPYYAIPEFTGSAWNVGHAVDSAHDTIGQAGKSVTMNTDSTGTGGPTFDVVDWSTATIFERSMGGDAGGETGLADCMIVTDPGSTTTTVDIRLGDNNARNDNTVYVHILQCDDLVVNRYESNNYIENNGGATYGTTVTVSGANASTPTSELSLEFSSSTTGTGTAWSRGALVAEIISSTQFRTYVHRSGNNVMVRAGIVDLSALVDSSGSVGLTPQDANHLHSSETPTLTVSQTLSPNNSLHSHSSESPSLGSSYQLSLFEGLHSHSSEGPTLSFGLNLSPNNAIHGHVADLPTLSASYALVPEDTDHLHSSEAPTLEIGFSVALENGAHAHISGQPSLSIGMALSASSGTHPHFSDSPNLSHSYSLTGDTSLHLQFAEPPTLTVSTTLAPNGGTHLHTAESTLISSGIILSVNKAIHLHSSEFPVLTQGFVVAVNDGLVAQTSKSPLLSVEYVLSINNGNHAHLSDEPTLSFGVSLSINSGLHGHTSDSPTLGHKYQVITNEANHGHIAESPTVFFSLSIVPNDGLNGHNSDSPNVFTGTSPVEILKYEVFVERNVSLSSQVDRNISSEILLTRSINMASEFTRNIKDEIFIERTIQLKSRVL